MSTIVITPEMQKENAEALLGKDPGKFRDPGHRWTAKRRDEMERMLATTEAEKPVTLLNLNPFPLKINGGVFFPEEVPACPLGKPYAVHIINITRWGHSDKGCDAQNVMQMEPTFATPLMLAAEYIREYVQQENGFGGVLCYQGDKDPATIKKGEIVRVPNIGYNGKGEMYVRVEEVDFHVVLARIRAKRNNSIMHRLQSATAWYENDSQRMNVNDTHRDLARLALQEGLIPELPRWVMQANTLQEKQPEPCPMCTAVPKEGSALCINCGYIFDVVKAFLAGKIAYGAVEMERLTPAEWAEVDKIQAERLKARGSHGRIGMQERKS